MPITQARMADLIAAGQDASAKLRELRDYAQQEGARADITAEQALGNILTACASGLFTLADHHIATIAREAAHVKHTRRRNLSKARLKARRQAEARGEVAPPSPLQRVATEALRGAPQAQLLEPSPEELAAQLAEDAGVAQELFSDNGGAIAPAPKVTP